MRRFILLLASFLCLGSSPLEAADPRPVSDPAEYAVTRDAEGWQAVNLAHGFRTRFDARGIRLSPRRAAIWAWTLTLCDEPARELRTDGNRVELDRGRILEWYVNDERGLEQGFTIASKGEPHLDLALGGDLRPVLSADGQAVDFQDASGTFVLRYAVLSVVDVGGRTLASRFEMFAEGGVSGIRIAFDDAGAAYPVTVDPLATSASWSGESNQPSAWFGYSVATAGDVNGDGFSDVIVGAPAYDNGQGDEGRAYLYLGSAAGLQAAPAWTAESDQANALFGCSVSSAGDVNGDGFHDVIVGAYGFTSGEYSEGRAYVYLGSATGLSTTPAWTAESNQVLANFGWSVAGAGDVNGDGYDDVIVGATGYSNGQSGEGAAFVYHGGPGGLSPAAARVLEIDRVSADFGVAVAAAGDVNADGYADVVVGADQYTNVEFNEGAAFLFLGSASGVPAAAAWTGEANSTYSAYGASVAAAGDVDGDGYADLLIGAPQLDNGENNEGRAYLYFGNASANMSARAPWIFETNEADAFLGQSVATAGDANGDGFADILIGAARSDLGAENAGRVYAFVGGPAITASPGWEPGLGPGQYFAEFGSAVATAGDVNGDGYSDVLIGSYKHDNGEPDEGRASVNLGSASGTAAVHGWTIASEQPFAALGVSVAAAGDVNGDGYSDVIVGASGYDNSFTDAGRALLYLGSSSGLAPAAAWSFEGDSPTARLGQSVAAAGDVNGDGFGDVIVGAPFRVEGQTASGRAYVFLGSAAGLAATPAWFRDGEQPYEQFGSSVASAGDVNGDGFADVVIGAPDYDVDGTSEGRALLFLGSPGGLVAAASWVVTGDSDYARVGHAVATAGDTNADGFADVIVGADAYSNGILNEGRADIYFGSAAGLATVPGWTAEGEKYRHYFGSAVGTAGDVNGDSYADVIVGAPYSDLVYPEGAYVYLGSPNGPATTPARYFTIEKFGSLGWSVATAGDVNGDGFSDILLGAPKYDIASKNEGRAYVVSGSPAGPGATPSWFASGDRSEANFGESVASAGDVNGDGFSDVVVGAPDGLPTGTAGGRVFVYYGGGGDGLDRVPRQAQTDGTTPIARGGKSDSEVEFRARVRGRTAAGRGRIRLQWEAAPLGTLFDGVADGASAPVRTGVPGSSGSTSSFNEAIGGLAEGTFYRWRVRTVSPDPRFPRSPWISLPGAGLTETKLRTAGCVDRDADGYGELSDPSCLALVPDCNDGDPGAWGTPGPAAGLVFSGKSTLSWSAPTDPGAHLASLVYDTLRSGAASNFLLADCIETADGADTTAEDAAKPSTGRASFYLVRARNSCPSGTGSLGTSSAGVERAGAACP
ncbi:MAG: FG-GAP repeat protein [Acidobacteria bacterium]|nr:FG-GAP repeat protein [Acidobacteriota bacterium]